LHCSSNEANGWTVFDDRTGHLASFGATNWVKFAKGDDLVFAGYNDSVPYGQLIVVSGCSVVREFLEDLQDPRNNVNLGRLDFEGRSPMEKWIDAASFVDEDELANFGAPEGLLWLFQWLEKDKNR
jgi:hypothetical protein